MSNGIWLRRFDAAGTPLGIETLVEAGDTDWPDVAMDPATGAFVVAWERLDGDYDIRARRYDAMGTPLAAAFDVNSSTIGDQRGPLVAVDLDGDFVINYSGNGQGDTQGVLGRLYDSDGVEVRTEFWVNATIGGYALGGAAAFASSGDFLVTWANQMPGEGFRAFAARFSPAGVRDGFSDFPLTLAVDLARSQGPGLFCADGPSTFRVPFSDRPFSGIDEEFLTQRISLGLFADGFESADFSAWSGFAP